MKYCWEYTDDYLEYRSSCGLDTKTLDGILKIFQDTLKITIPMKRSSQRRW
ncbi:MAG: hypothetical protein ACLTAI_06615 [Thomasclavelia sp.]